MISSVRFNHPHCWVCGLRACCGQVDNVGTHRCHEHRERNPCAVDGCTNSHKAKYGLHNQLEWVCGVHWKQVCPPRSPMRRTYLRFFRIARKLGVEKKRWPQDLENRYWRFFAGMVKRYNRRLHVHGSIDIDEINKLFGWDQ